MTATRRGKNKFSIKAVCYPNLRQRHIDGPWRPSKSISPSVSTRLTPTLLIAKATSTEKVKPI